MAYPMLHHDPTAVVGRRIWAYVLDGIIGFIVTAPFLYMAINAQVDRQHFATEDQASRVCNTINDKTFGTNDSEPSTDPFGTTGFSQNSEQPLCIPFGTTAYTMSGKDLTRAQRQAGLANVLIPLLNLVILQGLTGASVGKWLLGLRVVKPDGSQAGVGACAIRWLVLFIDSACFLIGLLTMTNSKGHRRLGDMAANTFVVRTADLGRPILIPGLLLHSQVAAGAAAMPAAPVVPPPPHASLGALPPEVMSGNPPTADGPHWDQARNTYIRYDRDASAWLEWDAAGVRWIPISQ